MPLQVTALIHRQALRLWLKRVPFHHKPAFVPGKGSVRHERGGADACATTPRARMPLVDRIAVAVLERELVHLEAGALEVTLPDGTRAPVRVRADRCRSVRIHDSALFRRIATRGKLGLGESYTAGEWDCDDLVGLFELLVRNAEAARRDIRALRRLLDARPTPRTGATASWRARRNIAYHYDLGNELLRADARRDDDLLLRRLRRARASLADAQRRQATTASATSCSSTQTTTCSRSAAAGAASRSMRRGRPAASVTALTISAEQARLARERVARPGSPTASPILEQDFREHDGPLHEGRVDRDARSDRRAPVRPVLRDDRPRARAGRDRVRADDPHPGRPLGRATATRRTGSSATSSRAA